MKTIPTASLQGAWRTLERRTNVLEPHEIGAVAEGRGGPAERPQQASAYSPCC